MLYSKAIHILFVISWMAGVFYLPRIFVHFVEGRAAGEDVRRLQVMAKRLYHFTSMMGVLALASGLWLWLRYGFTGGWLHAKLALVLLLVAYHVSMRACTKRLLANGSLPSSTALRWYNEVPLLILAGILFFVVVKPF
jgi:putative membrane protein